MRRFTVAEYHRLIDAGILDEDDRVELLEGWIVSKMAHNPPHDSMIDLVYGEVEALLPAGWYLRVQSAITTDDSEPEPDLVAVRGPRGRYAHRHPGPADVALLVEVADTSLSHDRNFKGPLYARAGIAVYWIVNLPESRVEVYTDPSGTDPDPRYRQQRHYGIEDSVPVVIDGREVGQVAVRKLFAEPDANGAA
jgi:Uma2 family endonuclease